MATATQKAKGAKENGKTKVLYLNLPADVADNLAEEAAKEDRPMSVQAARILKEYFDAKGVR